MTGLRAPDGQQEPRRKMKMVTLVHTNLFTRVSNGMAGGADLTSNHLPRPGSRPQNAASGLFIALVIQIPAVSALI